MGSENKPKTVQSNSSSATKRTLEGGINQCKTLEINKNNKKNLHCILKHSGKLVSHVINTNQTVFITCNVTYTKEIRTCSTGINPTNARFLGLKIKRRTLTSHCGTGGKCTQPA